MLSLIVFLPLIGAAIVASINRENRHSAGWFALFFAFQTFVFSLSLLQSVGGGAPGFALEENFSWLPAMGVRYHLGADALSFMMVALTGLLSTVAIAASVESVKDRQPLFFSLLLMLQSGINGAFFAQDLVLFYIFWELMLVPLYFLIGMFGSKNRVYAAVKFFLFTFFGSMFMLVAVLYLSARAGTSDYPAILAKLASGELVLSPTEAMWIFLGFFIAFAIKVPLFPFHTWLPDAHTEAPTAGSVMLAGVLLKTGVYGMIRFCAPLWPLFPAAHHIQWIVETLAAVAIIYGALAAIAQTDMKRLVAYSSVSHMGFIMLGLFAFHEIAVEGAILQMVNHGLSTSGLFLCVGMLYDRRHTREMSEFGGLAANMKIYAALTMIMVLSSVGLPGLNGFVGEF
jgi:NADH-quinone oxidoreductase subunit M